MRTNIVLDEAIMKEAFKYTNISTKRELVDLALREFIENHKRRDIADLRGKVKLRKDYNYKKLREKSE
ncbi:MAG: type II toxin-antitoxin system VapB family antitoxin [Proteobacteria bacterium]|nr:type II toxin-antitoxin system VapB family antitoxin [Pseudomonadota bacterium]